MIYLYSEYAHLVFTLAIAITVVLLATHFFLIGSKDMRLGEQHRDIQRFSLTDRVLHWIRMLTFIIVSISGIYLVFMDGGQSIGMLHSINGMIFFTISLLTLIIWYKQFSFKDYDSKWLRCWGGYLTKEHITLPAGRYNAGQKIFFWLTMVFAFALFITGIILMRSKISQISVNELILVCHGISAVMVIILVIGHGYLSLVANPGTWKVLISGKVSREWADYHHPNWNTDLRKR